MSNAESNKEVLLWAAKAAAIAALYAKADAPSSEVNEVMTALVKAAPKSVAMLGSVVLVEGMAALSN